MTTDWKCPDTPEALYRELEQDDLRSAASQIPPVRFLEVQFMAGKVLVVGLAISAGIVILAWLVAQIAWWLS